MASEDARKLFVAGLPDSVTEEVLRGLFAETGAAVADLTVPRDRMTGRPRGFAFVRLETQEDADRARQVLDGRIVDGKSISVRPFQAEAPVRGERPGGGAGGFRGGGGGSGGGGGGGNGGGGYGGSAAGNAADRTLYVGNLPYDTTQEELETLLRECGTQPVVRVHLPVDPDGRKRGFGFITVGSADVARNALDQLKGAELRGRRLNINIASPKGDSPPRSRDGGSAPPMGDRPPRAFGGGGGGFGGPPPNPGFGPPLPPGGKPIEGKRKKRFEGGEGEGRAAKRDRDERWSDNDDDE